MRSRLITSHSPASWWPLSQGHGPIIKGGARLCPRPLAPSVERPPPILLAPAAYVWPRHRINYETTRAYALWYTRDARWAREGGGEQRPWCRSPLSACQPTTEPAGAGWTWA